VSVTLSTAAYRHMRASGPAGGGGRHGPFTVAGGPAFQQQSAQRSPPPSHAAAKTASVAPAPAFQHPLHTLQMRHHSVKTRHQGWFRRTAARPLRPRICRGELRSSGARSSSPSQGRQERFEVGRVTIQRHRPLQLYQHHPHNIAVLPAPAPVIRRGCGTSTDSQGPQRHCGSSSPVPRQLTAAVRHPRKIALVTHDALPSSRNDSQSPRAPSASGSGATLFSNSPARFAAWRVESSRAHASGARG
jgi:hypothetical protein